jgi:hypothetical protein
MANEQDKNPTAGQESDISKSQATQQPKGQAGQQSELGQQSGQFETSQQGGSEQSGDQAATGQGQAGSSPDAGQSDTLTEQRTDVEGAGLSGTEGGQSGQVGGGFVGSQGKQDSSRELIDEDEEEFGKDGQGAPEGK